MSITWADVLLIAPEQAAPTVTVPQQNAILAEVNEAIVAASWGSEARADIGRKYLAAHIGSGVQGEGASATGAVISESAGPISVTYAAPTAASSSSDEDLTSTWYGRRYIAARDSFCLGRIGLVG